METTLKDTTEGLNHLIIIANDGKEGYAQAADIANDPILKAMFARYSAERAEFADALQALVANTGTVSESGGGPVGALHRVWTDIKASIIANDDRTTLTECLDGDKTAVSAYETVLKDNVLTVPQRSTLQTQLKLIQDALFSLEQELHKIEKE